MCVCSSSLNERDGIAITYPKESLGDEVNSFFTIKADGEGSGKVLAYVQASAHFYPVALKYIAVCLSVCQWLCLRVPCVHCKAWNSDVYVIRCVGLAARGSGLCL